MIRIRLFGTLRRCCAIAALALLADGAFAQPPEEVTFEKEDTITLRPGQSRIFHFGESVAQIGTPLENIVEITAQSDRTFTFTGIAAGETLVTARSNDGHVVHRMLVVVGGHVVKVYGGSKKDEQDYVGFMCDKTGCGHAEPNQDKLGSPSTPGQNPARDGGAVAATRNDP